MSLKKTLFKETLLYSIGSFGSKILSFVLIFLYSFFLSKAELGRYDLFITITMFFVPIALLQISDAVYRWLMELDKRKNLKKIKEVITGGFVVLIVTNLLLFVILSIVFHFKTIPYSSYFCIYVFLNSLSLLVQNILRGFKLIKLFSFYGVCSTLLLLLFNLILVGYYDLGVEGILLSSIFTSLISLIFISFYIKVQKYISVASFNKKVIRKMLSYSLPLIPNIISWWLISSASKFFILNELGIESNGIYAISNRFPSILILLNLVILLPIQDYLLHDKGNYESFRKIVDNIVVIELVLVLVLSLGAPIYTKFLVAPTYYSSWVFMPPLFLGIAFNTIGDLLNLIYQKQKNTSRIMITTLLGGVLSLFITYVSIKPFGLMGVSFAFLSGYVIMTVIRYIDVRLKYNFQLNVKKFLIGIFIFILFNIIQHNISFFWYQFLFFMIIIMGTIYLFREMITELFTKLRK